MKLFISLLKCDMITNLLFEKGTLEVFKNVFNCNWLNMGEMIEYLNRKYGKALNKSSIPVNKIIKEIKKDVISPKEKNICDL